MLNYLKSFIYAIVPDNDAIDTCNTIDYTDFIFFYSCFQALIFFLHSNRIKNIAFTHLHSRNSGHLKSLLLEKMNTSTGSAIIRLINYEV